MKQQTVTDREILAAALIGFAIQKTNIESRMAEVEAELARDRPERKTVRRARSAKPELAEAPKVRKMSRVARARISQAQRERWAAWRKQQKKVA